MVHFFTYISIVWTKIRSRFFFVQKFILYACYVLCTKNQNPNAIIFWKNYEKLVFSEILVIFMILFTIHTFAQFSLSSMFGEHRRATEKKLTSKSLHLAAIWAFIRNSSDFRDFAILQSSKSSTWFFTLINDWWSSVDPGIF